MRTSPICAIVLLIGVFELCSGLGFGGWGGGGCNCRRQSCHCPRPRIHHYCPVAPPCPQPVYQRQHYVAPAPVYQYNSCCCLCQAPCSYGGYSAGYGGHGGYGGHHGHGGYGGYKAHGSANKFANYMGKGNGEMMVANQKGVQTVDPICNSEQLRVVIEKHLSMNPHDTKAAIHEELKRTMAGKAYLIICSVADFSYIAPTDQFCQHSNDQMSCYVAKTGT